MKQDFKNYFICPLTYPVQDKGCENIISKNFNSNLKLKTR